MKPDAKNVWFVADTHFNHAKIIEHALRPFSSLAEMDRQLIKNWNDHVQPRDDVFHLGDVAWREAEVYRDKLNGNIHLIRGNHEVAAEKIKHRFIWVKDVYELAVREFFLEEGREWSEKQRIWLAHYAHRVWPRSHHGVWHLYGHSHGSLVDAPNALSLDVGVDATARWLGGVETGKRDLEYEQIIGVRTSPEDYRPISFIEIKKRLSYKKFEPIDHHTGREVG